MTFPWSTNRPHCKYNGERFDKCMETLGDGVKKAKNSRANMLNIAHIRLALKLKDWSKVHFDLTFSLQISQHLEINLNQPTWGGMKIKSNGACLWFVWQMHGRQLFVGWFSYLFLLSKFYFLIISYRCILKWKDKKGKNEWSKKNKQKKNRKGKRKKERKKKK